MFTYKYGHSDKGDETFRDTPPPELYPNRKTPIKTGKIRPPHFDEKTSEHLEQKRVLTGAAYVTDGDTITIKKTQIRLFGIDAPELNHPYGKKSKWALQKLCKGHVIHAEITDEDEYGRTVAHCYLPDGRDLSAEMVKQGLAIDWPKFSGGKYKSMETLDARKKLFLADARQKGRMHIWEKFEAKQEEN
ncbi:thermonuclease family protein [Tropicibacter oceani]|uniref:Thermonuclease family protein n=1 Tax=Tropicibacter oceani TaxID=3058420 RepID=A0ABY8QFP3_9RHOB|nr:thermonuclease family protein [Tropicibacter oceani]WGW03427.1 thermonuclease family protein [Tropicibacter oceani]